MTGQRYTDPVALERMAAGNCPECGAAVERHTGWGGPGCSLPDNGVASRLHAYKQDQSTRLPLLRRRSVQERLRYHAERVLTDPENRVEVLAAATAMEMIAAELDDEPARRPEGPVGS